MFAFQTPLLCMCVCVCVCVAITFGTNDASTHDTIRRQHAVVASLSWSIRGACVQTQICITKHACDKRLNYQAVYRYHQFIICSAMHYSHSLIIFCWQPAGWRSCIRQADNENTSMQLRQWRPLMQLYLSVSGICGSKNLAACCSDG